MQEVKFNDTKKFLHYIAELVRVCYCYDIKVVLHLPLYSRVIFHQSNKHRYLIAYHRNIKRVYMPLYSWCNIVGMVEQQVYRVLYLNFTPNTKDITKPADPNPHTFELGKYFVKARTGKHGKILYDAILFDSYRFYSASGKRENHFRRRFTFSTIKSAYKWVTQSNHEIEKKRDSRSIFVHTTPFFSVVSYYPPSYDSTPIAYIDYFANYMKYFYKKK